MCWKTQDIPVWTRVSEHKSLDLCSWNESNKNIFIEWKTLTDSEYENILSKNILVHCEG